jgi:hypothetical protein
MGGAKGGTIMGEAIRSGMQFKGFGASVVMMRARRMAYQFGVDSPQRAMSLEASLFVSLAILGATAMAMKDIKDGRDPRRWLDEKTYLDWKMWGAAFLQAGGMGIYGDFLFSEMSRFGGGLEKTIAGPLVGRAGDVLELASEPLKALKGEKINMGRKAMPVVRGMVPNLWFSSLVLQRTVFDRMQRAIDPEAQPAFNREIDRRAKEFGQRYWWQPGQTAPRGGPDMGRIFATR